MAGYFLPSDKDDLQKRAREVLQRLEAHPPLYAQPKKRSLNISGHQTSITLEDEYWQILSEICAALNISKASFIKKIDESRDGNLSSAVRIAILRIILD